MVTSFQGPFILSSSGRAARWTLERQSPKVKQVQGDEVGNVYLPSLCALRASARVRFARRGAEDAEGMHMRE